MERRHSRASSVDRREIFKKYITNGSEHEETLRPFANDDPELLKGEEVNRNSPMQKYISAKIASMTSKMGLKGKS